MKCKHCGKEPAQEYMGGLFFCQEHLANVYRVHDINKKLFELQKNMEEGGIKRGSLSWIKESLMGFKEIYGIYPKIEWKTDLKNDGLWAVIKIFFVYYFLL